jgi:FtsK/SpoIIIE family
VTCLTLGRYSINPLFGLSVIPIIKLTKLAIEYQKKPNIVLNTLRSMKEHLTNWELPLLNLIPLSFLSYKFDLPLWYAFYPLSLIEFCTYKWIWIKKRKELNIIDNVKGICRIYSDTSLAKEETKIEMVINSSIHKINQHIKHKNIFIVQHSKKPNDYRRLDKGSLERLIQVLKDLNANPVFESSQENDIEITHNFTLTLNVKMLDRQIKNIEHKVGLKKGTLSVDQDKGIVSFNVKKDVSKIYILDEVINDKPKNMQLPFVLGCDYKTGSVVIKDLLDVLHLLIAGTTGSGKSVTLHSIIQSLMYFNQNCCFYMLDFAEVELVKYKDFSNCKFIETDFQSIKNNILEIRQELDNRKNLFREYGVVNIKEYNNICPDNKIPYIVLTMDEANGLKEDLEKSEFEEIKDPIKALLKRGRKYGIIIIFAVQQTNDTDFVKSFRALCTRLGHLLNDHVDCNNLTTNKEVAGKIPDLGIGEFYLVSRGIKDIPKMKGCLTGDKLYEILKEVYRERVIPEIEIIPKQEVI